MISAPSRGHREVLTKRRECNKDEISSEKDLLNEVDLYQKGEENGNEL